jgi:hypothetical protein
MRRKPDRASAVNGVSQKMTSEQRSEAATEATRPFLGALSPDQRTAEMKTTMERRQKDDERSPRNDAP